MRAGCDIAAWRPWQSRIKDLGVIEARAYKRISGVVTASGGNHGLAVVHVAPISAWTMSNIRSPEGLSEVTINGDTVSTRRLPHFRALRAIPVSRPTAIPFWGTARCPFTRKLSARGAVFPPHTRERARGIDCRLWPATVRPLYEMATSPPVPWDCAPGFQYSPT